MIMRLYYKYAANLPLYTVKCHVFSSREENTITVNNTGGLCYILASQPVFLFDILCAKSLLSFQQLPPTQNPQDFPSLIQNCNQVRSLGGESRGAASRVCDVRWMATNCCAACQHVEPGALEREKWKINRRRLPERSRDRYNTWERWCLAWGTFQQKCTDMWHSITASHRNPQCGLYVLEPHKLCKPSTQHTEGQIAWWTITDSFRVVIKRGEIYPKAVENPQKTENTF